MAKPEPTIIERLRDVGVKAEDAELRLTITREAYDWAVRSLKDTNNG